MEQRDSLKAPGILVIWGGSDIHPQLYNRPNQGSFVGNTLSTRDQIESSLFSNAVQNNVPIVVVCRGAQLGCALSGGILVQHVGGHFRDHMMTTSDNKILITPSVHHQMMYPWSVPNHKLLAWSIRPRSSFYEGLTADELNQWPRKEYKGLVESHQVIEPEVVWFENTKCLAIQGHPEYLRATSPFNQYVYRLIRDFCL